jgi:hypothetical protein
MELNWKQIDAVERATVITTVDAHAAVSLCALLQAGYLRYKVRPYWNAGAICKSTSTTSGAP